MHTHTHYPLPLPPPFCYKKTVIENSEPVEVNWSMWRLWDNNFVLNIIEHLVCMMTRITKCCERWKGNNLSWGTVLCKESIQCCPLSSRTGTYKSAFEWVLVDHIVPSVCHDEPFSCESFLRRKLDLEMICIDKSKPQDETPFDRSFEGVAILRVNPQPFEGYHPSLQSYKDVTWVLPSVINQSTFEPLYLRYLRYL